MKEQDSNELVKLGYKLYPTNYKPRSVVFESGKGSEIWGLDGTRYLDFGSGIGVTCLGHCNPEILEVIRNQSDKLWHTSNFYFSKPPIRLAEEIVNRTFAEKVYFCNSGAEANEAAIKIARRYSHNNFGPKKRTILTFEGSFHGRTLAAVTATAQPKYHVGFEPLPAGFRYCKFNDLENFKKLFRNDVCAVLLEPIQGEGGIRPFSIEFLQQARNLCDQNHALLIFDEVQCGMGRTGKLFAYEWADGVVPDIVTVAKSFGAGLPIGAALLGKEVSHTLPLGSHGSTFGGNPVCCAVARVVWEKASSSKFLQQIENKGEFLFGLLAGINSKFQIFSEIRGKGLMIGAEFNAELGDIAPQVLNSCLENNLLVLQSGTRVLRLLPAYTISLEEIAEGVKRLEKVLEHFC